MSGMLPAAARARLKTLAERSFDTSVTITRVSTPLAGTAYGSIAGGAETTIAPAGTLVRIGPATKAQLAQIASEIGELTTANMTYSEDLALKAGDMVTLAKTGERFTIHSVDDVQSATFSLTNNALIVSRR